MGATRGTSTCMLANYERLVKTLDNIAGVDAEKVIKSAQRTQRAGRKHGCRLPCAKFMPLKRQT